MRFLVCDRHPRGGVNYHRLKKPFEFIEKAGHQITWFIDYKDIPDGTYDYLVFNRSIGWDNENLFLEEMKCAGIKIIMDIDDYWNLPKHHTIVWRKDVNYPEWRANIIRNMQIADIIWTSTAALKVKINELVDTEVYLCRNAIDYNEDQWKNTIKKKYPNKINIGYIGSTTHHMDLDPIKRPLERIHKTKWLDKGIMWHLCGFDDKSDYGKKVSKRFLDVMTTDGKYRNIKLWPGIFVREYAYLYNNLDISIASVLDNDFNKCKSELKVIEAGAKRVPFIGTDLITYSRTEANIDLCQNSDDWVNSIKELVQNKHLRVQLGKELGEYVRDTFQIERENVVRLSSL